jgi:transposase-like protein
MKWKELGGQERYQVVELVRQGKMTIKEICETFGVSRQALSRAMDRADQASVEALEPKKPGKKPKGCQEVEIQELAAGKADLEKELAHWKKKYEVARTFLELQRKLERGEKLAGEETPSGGKTDGRRQRTNETR